MAKEENQLNLTVVALVSLVAIVGLVALVLHANGAGSIASGSNLVSAEELTEQVVVLEDGEVAQGQYIVDENGNLAGTAYSLPGRGYCECGWQELACNAELRCYKCHCPPRY